MSTQLPRLEARVSAQERMQTILHARIEELAQDMTESFKQQAAYQVRLEQKIDARFDAVDAHFDAVDAHFDAVDAHFNKIEAEIGTVKSEIGTIKADIAAMEDRILGAFQQLVTIIDTRLPSPGKE